MKIAVQMPSKYDATDERTAAWLACVHASINRVKSPATEISIRSSTGKPNMHELGSRFENELLVLRCLKEAEREGADGVIDYCFFDPALWPARQELGIPVVGAAEASMHLAAYLGRRFAIVAPDVSYVQAMEDMIGRYGFRPHALPYRPVRPLDVKEADAMASQAAGRAQELADRFLPVARACLQDGADTLIVGCGVLSVILTEGAGLWEVDGAPLISPAIATVQAVEALISLRKAGLPVKAKRGYWAPS